MRGSGSSSSSSVSQRRRNEAAGVGSTESRHAEGQMGEGHRSDSDGGLLIGEQSKRVGWWDSGARESCIGGWRKQEDRRIVNQSSTTNLACVTLQVVGAICTSRQIAVVSASASPATPRAHACSGSAIARVCNCISILPLRFAMLPRSLPSVSKGSRGKERARASPHPRGHRHCAR